MVSWCVVPTCKNSGGIRENLHFHSFPKCDEMRALWIEAINRIGWVPSCHSKVCSDHFDEDDYLCGKKLKIDAVPSVYPVSKIQRVSEAKHDVHATVSILPSTVPIICDCISNHVAAECSSQEPEVIIPDFVSKIIYSDTTETNIDSQRIVDQQPIKNEINSDFVSKIIYSDTTETNIDSQMIVDEHPIKNEINQDFVSKIIYSDTTETNIDSQMIVDQQPIKNELNVQRLQSILNKSLKSKSRSVGTNTFSKNKDIETKQNERIQQMKLKIRKLQRQVQRKDKKLQELEDLLEYTKAQAPDPNENIYKLVHENFSGFMKDLVIQELSFGTVTKRNYNANVKEFASTLYSFSPKAYEFVTNFLSLPSVTSIRNWAAKTNCDSSTSLQSDN